MRARNPAIADQNRKNAHRVFARRSALIFQAAEAADFLNSDERTEQNFSPRREMHIFVSSHPVRHPGARRDLSAFNPEDTGFRRYDGNVWSGRPVPPKIFSKILLT